MNSKPIIVEGLAKKFALSLNSALKYGMFDGLRRMVGISSDNILRQDEFWALQNVSFKLESGDALGIMGVNGSGKTTLLRILNGTYSPNVGRVTLKGRIGALIAAGAGFSPMLSGRENIFINATLLGMTPKEIKARYDEIVDFAELHEFIDMPVRNYSSGMSVRLGFAIAVIGNPDILLVDEVLAVGDMSFQKKCFERINKMRMNGTTIILVSHAPGSIWAVCNKGLSLHKGQSSGIMSVEDACREYENNNMRDKTINNEIAREIDINQLPNEYGGKLGGVGNVLISKIEILNALGEVQREFKYGEDFILKCYVQSREAIEDVILRVQVDSEVNKAISIIDSYEVHGKMSRLYTGKQTFEIYVNNPCLRPGIYTFGASVLKRNIGIHLFYAHDQAKIVIKNTAERFFYADFRSSVQLDVEYRDVMWK